MFVRRKEEKNLREDYAHTFFNGFTALANLYQIKDEEKVLRATNAQVSFSTDKKEFDFFVVIVPSKHENSNDPYYFPIDDQRKFCHEENEVDMTISFFFNIDQEETIKACLEFHVTQDSFEFPSKFLGILTRLIYQMNNKKCYKDAPPDFKFDDLCPPIQGNLNASISETLLTIFEEKKNDKNVEFLALGEMFGISTKNQKFLINPRSIFSVVKSDEFSFKINIIVRLKLI